jgi:glycosyltransferase involved in cell wall biosynthesis
MIGGRRREGNRLASPPSGIALLTAAVFVASPVAAILALEQRFGLWSALLLGWVLGPIAAVLGAMLTLVWTTPFRSTATLSLRPYRPRKAAAPAVAAPAVRISVVTPAYNARRYLTRSLPPLLDLRARGEVLEVIVADDGSSDGGADWAEAAGAQVVRSPERRGPGYVRNLGMAAAEGDVFWFVDADVVVHPEAVARIRKAFADPQVVAVFGSYDDRPAGQDFGSQYKNLVHHHYHQNSNPEASTFWSGCGAVRRDALDGVGGFDAEIFTIPAMEDVDLGYRLRRAGGLIRLDREMLSTHLKIWPILELIHTDIFRRAIPWSRIMLQRAEVLDDMNVGTFERLRAACAGLTVLLVAAVALGGLSPWWLVPALLTLITGNWHLFRLFRRCRGVAFALAGIAFHQLYYLYSSACFVGCWVEARLKSAVAGKASPSAAEAEQSLSTAR